MNQYSFNCCAAEAIRSNKYLDHHQNRLVSQNAPTAQSVSADATKAGDFTMIPALMLVNGSNHIK